MKKRNPILGLTLLACLQVSAQLTESFEGTFPPTGWTTFIGANGLGTTYNWTSSTAYATDGSQCAFVRYENSVALNEDWLVTPQISLTGTGNVLTFDSRDFYSSNYGTLYYILVSTGSQTAIADFDTVATYTESDFGPGFQSFSVSLSAYDGMNVYVAFMMTNDDGDNWYLDNVYIGLPASCLDPGTPVVSNITAFTADVDWTASIPGIAWETEYGPDGYTPGTGTSGVNTDTDTSLTGLTDGTDYDLYVRQICAVGDTSDWVGPVSFSTPVACPAPELPGVSLLAETTAQVYWDGGTGTAWRIQWGPPGFNMATGTGAIGVLNVTNDTALITGLTAQTAYEFTVETDCSAGGFGYSTPTYNVPFTTTCATASLPYAEDFDSPGCMSVQIGGNSLDTWTALASHDGPTDNLDGTVFYMIDSDGAGSGVYMNDYLTTPYIDANSITGTLFLEFDQYFRPYSSGQQEMAEVEVWDGTSWNVVLSMDQNAGSQGGWGAPDHQVIDITSHANDSLQVRFHYYNASYEYWWAVDNVEIREVNCLDPTLFAAYSVGEDSISVSWLGNNGISWTLEYGPEGFTPGSGTMVTSSDTSETLSGLTGATVYEIYIQAECALGQLSDQIGPLTVATSCIPYSIPWNEGFEGLEDGEFPLCLDTTLTVWAVDTGMLAYNRFPHSGNGYIYGNWSSDGWIFTPEFFLEANKAYKFSFWYVTDGNSGWQVLETAFGGGQSASDMTYPIGSAITNAVNTTYEEYTVTFSPLANGYYHLGIHMVANSTPWYITLDDLSLEETTDCAPPQPLTTSNITPNSVELTWGSNAAEWQLAWGPAGFTQGTTTVNGTLVSGITSNPYTLSGLPADSCLSLYVRSICGTDTSAWSARADFCTPPTCPAPTMAGVEGVTAATADIYWATGGASNWNVSYGAPGTAPGAGMLVNATNDSIQLTGLSAGTYYEFYVRDSCAAGDVSSWTGPIGFRTECTVQSLPYLEEFNYDLGCFEVVIGGSTNETWKWVTDYNGDVLGGSTGFMFIDSDGAGQNENQNDYAYSPVIDASGLPAGDSLYFSFNQYYNYYGADTAKVDIWDGTQWVNLLTQTLTDVGSWSSPDYKEYNITTLANANLQVRFHYIGDWDWYWAVDSVFIGVKSSCNAPLSLAVSNETCTEAEVSWSNASTGADSELEYGSAGFAPGTGTGVVISLATSPYQLTGLTPGTDYDVYVRHICAPGDTSDWSAAVNFQSATGPLPGLDFGWTQTDTAATSGEVTFDASNTTDADSLYWDFGGAGTNGTTVTNTYAANGIYSVTVTAYNGCGSVDSTFSVTLTGIGLDESGLERSFSLYPNPTAGKVTVRLEGQAGRSAEIRVTNSLGQIILLESHKGIPVLFERTLDLSGCSNGLYFIELKNEAGSIHRQVIKR